MNICMLVGTDMSHDARVGKEARTLTDAGHRVTVLAAFNSALPAEETQDGVRIVRLAPPEWRRWRPAAVATQASASAVAPLVVVQTFPPPLAHNSSELRRGSPTSLRQGSGGPPELQRRRKRRRREGGRSAMAMRWLRGLWWQIRLAREALLWMRRVRPDIIHIHDADRLLIGFIGHLLLGCHFVYDAHEFVAGLLVDGTRRSRWTRRWHLALERLLASRALAVITVNDAIAERLRNRYRLRNVAVVHNFPLLTPLPCDGGRLRERLPERIRNRPILVYQGRLTSSRGIEVFIQTIARVPAAGGVIIGSGPLRSALEALAAELRVEDRLVFVPEVPWRELAAYTAGADLGFCLSQPTCENNVLALPNKLFEYLMAGVPVIASDYPILRRYIVGENAGLLVSPDNPEHISEAVAALLADPDRLSLMRRNARRAAQRYNWTGEERILTTLYSRVHETPASARSAPWQPHVEDVSRR